MHVQKKGATERLFIVFAAAIGLFVTITTLYGVWHFHSSTVYWDEWDGYIGFYMQVLDGAGIGNWLVNHVDHRIFTSRVLFWLDLKFFHGSHTLLFVAELAMLAGIVAIVARAGEKRLLAVGLGAAFMLSWAQSETLRWGFETSIVSAFLFAVWSVYLFTRMDWPAARRFVLAYIAAALAELSMGNGIVTPLVLVAVMVVMRRPLRELAVGIVLAAIMIPLYFIGIHPSQGPAPADLHGSRALMIVKFFCLALGNPLSQLGAPLGLCMIIGALTFLVMAVISVRLWLRKDITPYRAFLIGTWMFAIASVALITIGRSSGGFSQAILSRYTTGPLLAWLSLALLAADSLAAKPRQIIVGSMILLAAVTAISQRGVHGDNSYIFVRKLGMLSYKIGLERPDYTWQLFPQVNPWRERFVQYARFSADHRLGIYDEQWLRDAGAVQFDPNRVVTGCTGHVEHVTRDPDGVLRVSGWLAGRRDTLIVFTDDAGTTIGYGVTGVRRPDVLKVIGSGINGGWLGFARNATDKIEAYSYKDGHFCKLH